MTIVGLHHFAIPMPVGNEAKAREFYGGVLGLVEVAKPKRLAVDGGVWFGLPDGRHVHLQSSAQFEPLRHPHPALMVADVNSAAKELETSGHPPRWDERWDGVRRFFVADPFGNRIEIVEAASVGQ